MKIRDPAEERGVKQRRFFLLGLAGIPAAVAQNAMAASEVPIDPKKVRTKRVSAKDCVDANECMRRLTAMDDTADDIDWRFDRVEIMRTFQLARADGISSSAQLILDGVKDIEEDVGNIRELLDTCITGVKTLKELVAGNKATLEDLVAQIQCINKQLDCLSCALCSLRGAIIRGKIFAFVIGFLMGMGVGAAIGGATGGAGIASVAIW